jgi:predicted DNA-binding transcriptional regulator YafY
VPARLAVEPLALGRDEGRWWLFAWCRRERAGRAFPLDRIADAWLTTEAAPARDVRAVFEDIPADASALALPGEADG